MEEKNHIYPIFDRMMTREDKEELLGQHSVMIWFTGLSGSGKSTIAIALERELHKRGLLCPPSPRWGEGAASTSRRPGCGPRCGAAPADAGTWPPPRPQRR